MPLKSIVVTSIEFLWLFGVLLAYGVQVYYIIFAFGSEPTKEANFSCFSSLYKSGRAFIDIGIKSTQAHSQACVSGVQNFPQGIT